MDFQTKKTAATGFAGRRLYTSNPLLPTGRRPNPLTLRAEEAVVQGNPYWRVVRGAALIIFLPILAAEIAILLFGAA